jgi:glycosyltransferase involved in cell wall biosynthesis
VRIALVHDWLTDMGGAESVFKAFIETFPTANLYTSIIDHKRLPKDFADKEIETSFLQKLPRFLRKSHRNLFPFYPFAFESFDFFDFDIVLTSTVFAGKGIITGTNTKHICYCHTPTRHLWEYRNNYSKSLSKIKSLIYSTIGHSLRTWDFNAAQRIDSFIANSKVVQERIKKTYRRDSVVIYPPVRCHKFLPSETDGDYYLVVSRFVEYKRVDLAIKACNELGRKLILVGSGQEAKKLRKLAGETISFVENASDEQVKKLMSECLALLFPGEEDFGIVPVEAMSCGRPVIAFGRGGALDTVMDGKTGVLFGEQTVGSLKAAMERFEAMAFDKRAIREHALKFDESVFREKIMEFVKKAAEEKC